MRTTRRNFLKSLSILGALPLINASAFEFFDTVSPIMKLTLPSGTEILVNGEKAFLLKQGNPVTSTSRTHLRYDIPLEVYEDHVPDEPHEFEWGTMENTWKKIPQNEVSRRNEEIWKKLDELGPKKTIHTRITFKNEAGSYRVKTV